jgi:hypothetical protein
MKQFKKEYKKLYKSHKKQLRLLFRTGTQKWIDPTTYFIAYLKMIRDYKVLSTPYIEKFDEKNLDLTALVTAISEYELSQTCIEKYYTLENGVLTRITSEDEETTLQKFRDEKLFHWEAFWNIVKMNIEDWVI